MAEKAEKPNGGQAALKAKDMNIWVHMLDLMVLPIPEAVGAVGAEPRKAGHPVRLAAMVAPVWY